MGFVADSVELELSYVKSLSTSFCQKICLIVGSSLRTSRISLCFCVSALGWDFVEEEETSIFVRVDGQRSTSFLSNE